MFSAVDFLPRSITTLQNLATIRSRNFGSGRIFRFGTSRRRGIVFLYSGLRALHAVLRATLRAVRLVGIARTRSAGRVERATHHVITNAGKVLHAAAADEHHRVLLQVVPFTRDVGGDFDAVAETNARDLA